MAFNNLNSKTTYTRGADIASASELPISSDGDFFHVTGTTGITSFSSLGVGMQVVLEFNAVVILTHNGTSLILPGNTDYTTTEGDTARFVEDSLGNWRCINIQGADGGSAGEISNIAYDATSWNGVTAVGASKNAIRDKIETMGAASISDTAYDATSWDGVTDIAPSKNAIRDKIEAMPAEIVSDTAYDESTWDGVTTIAPSKNAVRDKIEVMISDTAYDATSWDGVTTIAPSKNAVRDKIESMGSASVSDTAYDATSWDDVTTIAPSKNAVRDKIEVMISDTAYDATSWNGVTDIAPSKNAVRDKIETISSGSTGTWTATATCSTSGTITLYSTKNLMSYHRIGDTVFYQGRITATSVSSPIGSIVISLPYTAASGTEDSAYSSSSTYFNGVNGQIWGLFAKISPGTDYIVLGEGTGAGGVSGVTAQECQANTSYIFNGSYIAVTV